MIMQRTKKLTFLTSGYAQISIVFPFIVISPAYFGGAVQLGGLMQTASAFTSVQGALSFFVTAYRQLAEWRAVIARLDGFNIAVERARAASTATPAIAVSAREGKDRLEIDDLLVRLPQGTALRQVLRKYGLTRIPDEPIPTGLNRFSLTPEDMGTTAPTKPSEPSTTDE